MLLNIVSLTRDIRSNNSASRKLNTSGLAFSRVGLLGSDDTNTETHALESRTVRVGQGRRDGVTGSLALSNTAEDLV